MRDKSRRVAVTSHWRDSLDEAKSECNSNLDSKVDDVIDDEERSGWHLVSGTYSSFSIEHDRNRSLYRCSRSKTLRFREYEKASSEHSAMERTISADLLAGILAGTVKDSDSGFTAAELAAIRLAVEQSQETFTSGTDLGGKEFFANLRSKLRPLLPQQYLYPIGFSIKIPLPISSIDFALIIITKSNLRLSEHEEIVGLPLGESVLTIPISNCGNSITFHYRKEHRYEHVSGYRIELKNEISDRYTVNGSLKFKKGEMGGTIEKEVKFSESREYSSTNTETRSETIEFDIPANTMATVRFVSRWFEARREFRGPIVIDCDIITTFTDGRLTGTNRHRLSALLPNEADRLFTADGTYANIDTRVLDISTTHGTC